MNNRHSTYSTFRQRFYAACALSTLLLSSLSTHAASLNIRFINEKADDVEYKDSEYIRTLPSQPLSLSNVQSVNATIGEAFSILESETVTSGHPSFPDDVYITEIRNLSSGDNLVDTFDGTVDGRIAISGSSCSFVDVDPGQYRITAFTVRQVTETETIVATDYYFVGDDSLSGDIFLSPVLQPEEDSVPMHVWGVNGYMGNGIGIDAHGVSCYISAEITHVQDLGNPWPTASDMHERRITYEITKLYEYHVGGSIVTHVADGEDDDATVLIACAEIDELQEKAGLLAKQYLDSDGNVKHSLALDAAFQVEGVGEDPTWDDLGQAVLVEGTRVAVEHGLESLGATSVQAFAGSIPIAGAVNVVIDYAQTGDEWKTLGGVAFYLAGAAASGLVGGGPENQ